MQKTDNIHAENKRIILNWMPPASVYWPSPAMSVLQSYLVNHGFVVEIEYWNLHLKQLHEDFIGQKPNFNDHASHLYLLFNYLAIQKRDLSAFNKMQIQLKTMRPNFINVSNSYFDERMVKYKDKVDEIFDKVIKTYDFSSILYIGFEANLYQWIGSSILAEKIKALSPNTKTIIGGIGTRQVAIEIMKKFPQFDFAMWGEGEASLLSLSNMILNEEYDSISHLKNLAYRKDGVVHAVGSSNNQFVDLSDDKLKPNYDDYFHQIQTTIFSANDLRIPIEGSRSCHWKKCHFCYLNTGYKFRKKSIPSIISEMDAAVKKYGITKFIFLDNDLVANDLNRFNMLLDKIISLKSKYPMLSVMSAEIITKGLNAGIIRKMAVAGFKYVQIGYESSSDSLLKKINKKNTFSSNLLFIKFARKFKINIEGVNVIRFLYEENDDDIVESIKNLHYLRFFYGGGFLSHTVSNLAVTESSPYYKQFGWKDKALVIDSIAEFLPANFIDDLSKSILFESSRFIYNLLWDKFDVIENYYRSHRYDYSLIRLNDRIFYYEYLEDTLINTLEFNDKSLDWYILTIINENVLSVDEIYNRCRLSFNVEQECIISSLKDLIGERLIYHNSDFSENIAIIDTHLVK